MNTQNKMPYTRSKTPRADACTQRNHRHVTDTKYEKVCQKKTDGTECYVTETPSMRCTPLYTVCEQM